MTATLIVILIVTILAILILPFMRAMMKDLEELHENPLEQKFSIFISRVNEVLMNGNGEVVKFKNGPRYLNLFDDNQRNMIINIMYSTGTLTAILKYKYYHVELVKKMQFHQMRQAETFMQMDAANHFCEEAIIAITNHQEKVMGHQQEMMKSPNYQPSSLGNGGTDNPVSLMRGMYDVYTHEQKVALLCMARMIYMADGSSEDALIKKPEFTAHMLTLEVNYDEILAMAESRDEDEIIAIVRENKGSELTPILITFIPFGGNTNDPAEPGWAKLIEILTKLGYNEEEIENECEKLALIMQQMGLL